MSEDIEEHSKALLSWRDRTTKTISQILQRIINLNNFKGINVQVVFNDVTTFHRDITKQDESIIDTEWFPLCITLKKKLKKLLEVAQKQKKGKLELQKKPSQQIEFPAQLFTSKSPSDIQMIKFIYKSFVSNFEESEGKPQTINFVQSLLKQVKYLFEDKSDTEASKRVNSICLHLARPSSKESKISMLEGKILPKNVALDDEQVYMDTQTRQRIKKQQLQQLEESQTGYYDEMKKNINKNASQECRFCHQKKAYCEDMKQIRASDEPMTRFMRCNACGKAWRD